jgi:hypothetical protein
VLRITFKAFSALLAFDNNWQNWVAQFNFASKFITSKFIVMADVTVELFIGSVI